MNPFRKALQFIGLDFRSNLSDPEKWLIDWAMGGGVSASGQIITEKNSLQIPAVWACVTAIAQAISSSPLELYRRTADGNGKERATDHPLYHLMKTAPNDEMTAITFRDTLQGHLSTWGNAYAEIERNGAGQPIALWPLRPDRTWPRRLRNGGQIVYVAVDDYSKQVYLDPSSVLHVPGFSWDGLRGYSPIALHREPLGLARATEDYGARFFGNDSRPGGVLKHPNKMKPEALARMKASWEEAHRGGEKSHRVAILEEGMEWQQIGLPPEDSQFIETQRFTVLQICRIFHVPPHKVAELERATYSNIEQQAIEFVQDAIVPSAERWEQELGRKLLRPDEYETYFFEHNLDGLLRGDIKSRYEAHAIAVDHGWKTRNEVRGLENLNPSDEEGANKLWAMVNTAPMESIVKKANEPPPPDAPGPLPGPAPPKQLPAAPSKAKQASSALISAQIPVFQALAERVIRKEVSFLSRAAHSAACLEAFTSATAEFYSEHGQFVARAFLPGFLSLGATLGETLEGDAMTEEQVREYANHVGDLLVKDSTEELRRAVAAFASRPTDIREAVEAMLAEWSEHRAAAVAKREAERAAAVFGSFITHYAV